MGISFLLIKASQASILIPIIAGLRYYKRLEKPYKWFIGFFILSGLVEIAATQMMHLKLHNNMPLLHGFTVIEGSIFIYIYYIYFKTNRFINRSLILVYPIFLFLVFADAFWIDGIWNSNSWARGFECLILVILAHYYFYIFFKENFDREVWSQPMFWLSAGVLFYFALNIPFFMLYSFFISGNYQLVYLGLNIHSIINIFTNILFAITFLCFQPKTN